MALNAQKSRDVLTGLGREQALFIEPPAKFRAWLSQKQLSGDVVDFLVATAVAANVPFPNGCGGMRTPRDIMVLNDQEPDMLAGGLLAVGNSTSGDFIVIDLRDDQRQAGFVGHDELARNYEEAQSWRNVREIFAPVADSLDEMLAGMSADHWRYWRGETTSERPGYPWDYCDALSWKKGK
jgi:hypothetical protein